jgi:glutamate-1-semialdehyde 2,1-aminomutase
MINREKLSALYAREQATFAERNPKSKAAYQNANHLFGKVPMTWMNKKAGGFPIYFDRAVGNRIWDIDGHEYIDFALGDTGAMAGHSAPAVVDAITNQVKDKGGLTVMLPTEDAEWVARNLTERFGMTKWSFSLTATDANRWAILWMRL